MHKLANVLKNELQEHIVVVCEPGACGFTHVSLQDGRAGVETIDYHRPHNLCGKFWLLAKSAQTKIGCVKSFAVKCVHKCNLLRINATFIENKCNFLTFLLQQKLALFMKFNFIHLIRFRCDNARAFQRVSMNLNMTVGQATCRLLCPYSQNTLSASCVCWIVPIVTCKSGEWTCGCSCLKYTWSKLKVVLQTRTI